MPQPTVFVCAFLLSAAAPLAAQSWRFQPSLLERPDVRAAVQSVDARAGPIVDEWIKIELDARRLYLREGCASLFTYSTQVLHLAEGAAYNRIEVARLSQRFPAVLNAIAAGTLTLTTARLLAPHLTFANHAEFLDAARHKTKRDVELLVATRCPQPVAPTLLRKVAARSEAGSLPAASSATVTLPARIDEHLSASVVSPPIGGVPRSALTPVQLPSTPAPLIEMPKPRSAHLTPLSASTYRLQVTLPASTHEKLCRARDLLRHSIPDGDLASVLDRAITLLLADIERQRCAATCRPRFDTPRTANTRHIPAAVKRVVWRRDQGRCAFGGAGRRCSETAFLEFHHVIPYAEGGLATVRNIELRCRAHNQYEASLWFGEGGDTVRKMRARWATDAPHSFRNECHRAGHEITD